MLSVLCEIHMCVLLLKLGFVLTEFGSLELGLFELGSGVLVPVFCCWICFGGIKYTESSCQTNEEISGVKLCFRQCVAFNSYYLHC